MNTFILILILRPMFCKHSEESVLLLVITWKTVKYKTETVAIHNAASNANFL